MGMLILGINVLSIMIVLAIWQIWVLKRKVKVREREKVDLTIQLNIYREEEMQKFQDSMREFSHLIGRTVTIKGAVRTTLLDVEKNTFTLEIEKDGAPIKITMRMKHLQKLKF